MSDKQIEIPVAIGVRDLAQAGADVVDMESYEILAVANRAALRLTEVMTGCSSRGNAGRRARRPSPRSGRDGSLWR